MRLGPGDAPVGFASGEQRMSAGSYGVAGDRAGNVFISDTARIQEVTASTKKISTVAAGGASLGDNGLATKAGLSSTYGVAVYASTPGATAKNPYIFPIPAASACDESRSNNYNANSVRHEYTWLICLKGPDNLA